MSVQPGPTLAITLNRSFPLAFVRRHIDPLTQAVVVVGPASKAPVVSVNVRSDVGVPPVACEIHRAIWFGPVSRASSHRSLMSVATTTDIVAPTADAPLRLRICTLPPVRL